MTNQFPIGKEYNVRARAGEFLAVCRLVAAAKGDMLLAHRMAERGYTPRVGTILKSAVAAGSMSDSNWAGTVADYQATVSAFFESLRNVGVFDRMLVDMKVVPTKARGAVVTGSIAGDTPPEGMVKLISSLSFDSKTVAPRKSAAIVVVTSELLRHGAPGRAELFNTELRNAVVAATDTTFLSGLYAAVTPTGSAGASLANIVTDLGVLLSAVTTGAASRLYFIIDATNAKKLSLKASSIGTPAFPNFGPNGGEIIPGITGIVSDNLPSGAALLVDATQLMGATDTMTIETATQAAIQFQTAPDSPPTASTTLRSLWQENEVALMCHRYWGYGISRSTAIAALSGVAY
jgi:hypothetical protein